MKKEIGISYTNNSENDLSLEMDNGNSSIGQRIIVATDIIRKELIPLLLVIVKKIEK